MSKNAHSGEHKCSQLWAYDAETEKGSQSGCRTHICSPTFTENYQSAISLPASASWASAHAAHISTAILREGYG